MRIVCVGTFALFPKATVSTRTLPLAQALAKRGHEVSVIVPPWDNPSQSGKRLLIGNVPVVNVRVPKRVPFLWHLAITVRLLSEINKSRPEIVHIFKPKAHGGLAAMAIRLGRCARLVVDTDDWEGKGGWNEVAPYNPWQKAFFAFQEQWLLRHANAVTAASSELTRIAASLRQNPACVFYVPNCLSPEILERRGDGAAIRQRLGLGAGPVVLLFTRFFEFQRERVVRVLAKVLTAVPQAWLLVVGRGLYGEEEDFAALCRTAGIAERVSCPGWAEPGEIGAYFAASDLAIYPLDDTLLNRTKCPMKLLEILGFGLPVVADDVGQAKEYIENGQTGYLVAPDDEEGFAGRVIALLRDSDLRQRLGSRARERITTDYTWERWVGKVEEAYSCGA
jgi:glycosyltransferase involved in cell wall biosynthesis